jgi:outer membrane assembly lipoprotein YfiO
MSAIRTPRAVGGIMGVSSRRRVRLAVLLTLAVTAACSRGFQLRKYPQLDALFTASVAEFKAKRWDNAVTGFEKLTLDLSARDTLLPLSHWYLAQAHEQKGEHILASTSFSRLAESFPDDSLADDALLQAGNSYLRLWRNAELDPQYGTLAQAQYRTLLSVYPESPLRKEAETGLSRIDEQFAEKDYLNGLFYVRRGGFDSAIIYFKSVVKDYPNSDHARLALLRMVEVYRKPQMNYKEEAAETCTTLKTAYPTDKEVVATCGTPTAAADSVAKPVKPAGAMGARGR